MERMRPHPLLAFYRSTGTDGAGRMLDDIWAWNNDRIETTHDFIQWLFPLEEPSSVNLQAPTVNEEVRAEFAASEELRARLRQSFERMLAFYGFERADGEVRRAPSFRNRATEWLNPSNHNFRRITRILRCLTSLGLPDEAQAFFRALVTLYREYHDIIGSTTFAYWKDAVR